MNRDAILLLSTLCLFATDLLAAEKTPDFAAMRTEVEAIGHLTEVPEYEVVDRPNASPTLRPIIYTGADYRGKPTKVFAWLGVPENAKGKVPGVVLVHGGGGTAFKDWVAHWNSQGYAAISMSLEGHDDKKAKLTGAGPERPGVYGDATAPLKDQWMYQVITNTTLAANLLRSLPEVDPDKIGINGCSWGGIITATAIGIDPRYAFAIPVYGCGGLDSIPNHYSKALAKNDTYKKVWDSHLRLDRARMPILWHSWPQDMHFPMPSLALSRNTAKNSESLLCLISKMGHGNLKQRPEWFVFADSVVKDGHPWIREKSTTVENGKIQAIFETKTPLDSATLFSSTGDGPTCDREWIESPAHLRHNLNTWTAEADIPPGTTACYLNVNAGPVATSSDYMEIP